MSLDKRLDDLEASLSADQIWFRWLDATTSKFGSYRDYMKWAGQDLGNRLPFPTFDRELTPYATLKTREKESERTKKLLRAQETLRFRYCLFREVDETVNRQSSPLIAFGLEVALRRLADDLIADSHPLRSVSVPMRHEEAAMVRTALDNYLMPQRDFCDNLCRWIGAYCTETAANGTATGPEQRLAKGKEVRRTLFRIGAIKWGCYVELEPFPFRSLGVAALVEARWLDTRLLELAEFAALLVVRGFRPQDPPDLHPLGFLPFANNAGVLPTEQEFLSISNEVKSRWRGFNGSKRNMQGEVYVDIDEYRSWSGRAVIGDLKPMRGVHVAHWNQCLDALRGAGRAEIAGVKLNRLRAPFRSSDFIECEDDTDFARRSEMRSMLLEKIHGLGISAVGGPISRSLLREELNAHLVDLLASRDLVKGIEEQFGGHQFVFSETKEQLARQITRMQNVAIGFNLMLILAEAQGFNEPGSAGSQIDLDSAAANAEERSEIIFKTIKLRAEAFALESLGRHAGAMKIAAELMAESTAATTDGAQASPEPKAPDPPGPSLWERLLSIRTNWTPQ